MKNKSILIFGVLLFILGFASSVHAQAWLNDAYNQVGHAAGTQGAGYSDPMDPRLIAANIVRLLLGLVGTVLFVLICYSGFKWMTAQGNDEQIASAKKTITNSTIGLLIIISAYGITIMITNLALGRSLRSSTGSGASLDTAVQNWFR